ncbi:MAG: hypothetical protein R2882_06295 [Gemmatimonadales bacterium]
MTAARRLRRRAAWPPGRPLGMVATEALDRAGSHSPSGERARRDRDPGLGLGATTAIYSVVDTLMIWPLPYPDADRLVVIGNTVPSRERLDGRDDVYRLQVMSHLNHRDLRPGTRAQLGVVDPRLADPREDGRRNR